MWFGLAKLLHHTSFKLSFLFVIDVYPDFGAHALLMARLFHRKTDLEHGVDVLDVCLEKWWWCADGGMRCATGGAGGRPRGPCAAGGGGRWDGGLGLGLGPGSRILAKGPLSALMRCLDSQWHRHPRREEKEL